MASLRIALTALALVTAMVLAAMIGRRERVGIVILVLLCFVWFTLDRAFEAGVILTVSSHHGLVTSDLVGILGLGVAFWLWFHPKR